MGVFVGDTHGDLDATEKVISRFLGKAEVIVFLGDYVDRGTLSRENIDYLFRLKQTHGRSLFLLAGNHEGYMVKSFSPAHFWESLAEEERTLYGEVFSTFPLVATSENGILALHGAIPDLETLEGINGIGWGDEQWDRIIWGDFIEKEGEILDDRWGRPQFGRDYFDRLMHRYGKQLLIRSHQPTAPLFMFKKRCITLFTSYAYVPERHVALVELDREIRSAEDVLLEEI
jgi:protein phosphatase